MAPSRKFHNEKLEQIHVRVTPTGRKLFTELYIGDGKLASCLSEFLEEWAMGNIVALRCHDREAVPGISEETGEALTNTQANIALKMYKIKLNFV
jgi:hypothetical protein